MGCMMVIRDQHFEGNVGGQDWAEREVECPNPQGTLEQELSIRMVLNLAELAETQYPEPDQSLIVGYPGRGMI